MSFETDVCTDTWYNNYPPNSIGRILHFIRNIIDNPIICDNLQIGNNKVYYNEPNIIAEFNVDKEGNPNFKFFGEHFKEWEKNQKERRNNIIELINYKESSS